MGVLPGAKLLAVLLALCNLSLLAEGEDLINILNVGFVLKF